MRWTLISLSAVGRDAKRIGVRYKEVCVFLVPMSPPSSAVVQLAVCTGDGTEHYTSVEHYTSALQLNGGYTILCIRQWHRLCL